MSKQNTAMNEFTGDNMSTGHVSDEYRNGHTRIYGDKNKVRYSKYVAYHIKNKTLFLDYEAFLAERGKEPRWMTHIWDGENE